MQLAEQVVIEPERIALNCGNVRLGGRREQSQQFAAVTARALSDQFNELPDALRWRSEMAKGGQQSAEIRSGTQRQVAGWSPGVEVGQEELVAIAGGIVGLVLEKIAVDGCITKAPGGGEVAGRSPVDRGKQGMKRSSMVEGYGIPLGRVLAGANRHDSPLLASTVDKLDEVGPLPEDITVHLDAGYDSQNSRDTLAERGMTGQIAHKGDTAPIQATQRWHVERTNAWHNAFNRLQRCYERREIVIDAFFDLADAIITVRSTIRKAWTTHRWDTRPACRP